MKVSFIQSSWHAVKKKVGGLWFFDCEGVGEMKITLNIGVGWFVRCKQVGLCGKFLVVGVKE